MNKVLSVLQSSSAAGGLICGLSLMEINAILGIILTLVSLVLLVVPKIINFINSIKEAKKDGKITEEEAKDIIDKGLDIAKDVKDSVEDIQEITKNKKEN